MSDTRTQTPCELQFLLDSLYDINDDVEFDAYDDYDEAAAEADYLAEVASELAFARSLEARAERGTWFGRDPEGY